MSLYGLDPRAGLRLHNTEHAALIAAASATRSVDADPHPTAGAAPVTMPTAVAACC